MPAARLSVHRAVALAVAGVMLVVAFPIDAGSTPPGPATSILGTEPGTEKHRIVAESQREADAAAAATLGPARGRPAEAWDPSIAEGIVDELESPFEGRPFVLSDAWQSGLSADGRVTRVYAGTEHGRSLLIVLRQVLQTGERELLREVALPPGVGRPRLIAARDGVLEVATATGAAFRLDVARVELRAAPVR